MGAFLEMPIPRIMETNPVELGTGGYCFLAAELLVERYPNATLYRLTDANGMRFAHVFIQLEKAYADIEGFREVNEMRFDLVDEKGLIQEPTDDQSVRHFFYPRHSTAELCAARNVLAHYIATHDDIFPTGSSLAEKGVQQD